MNDDWKNFEPRKNAPIVATSAKADVPEVDINLDTITIDDMKTLARRLLCQCGRIAMMTDEETAQAILDRFASEAITGDIKQAITAGTAWFDRKEGQASAKPSCNCQR